MKQHIICYCVESGFVNKYACGIHKTMCTTVKTLELAVKTGLLFY